MLQDLATLNAEAEEVVRSIGIPPCPAILAGLVREMRADEPDFPKIGKLIGGDVALASAMLKTVNSQFYGLPSKATSVSQALALMGLRNVSQLMTGLLLRQVFPSTSSQMMERFWETSSRIALVCAWLASRLRTLGRDDAYTYGLFRDCGMPVLMLKFADYSNVVATARADRSKSLKELEEDRYWIDHSQVGHYLAKSWYLPEPTCLAILCHHDCRALEGENTELTAASLKLVAVGLLAEHLLQRHAEEPPGSEWQSGGDVALSCLGIPASDLDELVEAVNTMLAAHS